MPFSNHTRRGPSKTRDYTETAIEAPLGAAILFDSKLWHRVGANTTADSDRLAANLVFA